MRKFNNYQDRKSMNMTMGDIRNLIKDIQGAHKSYGQIKDNLEDKKSEESRIFDILQGRAPSKKML